MPKGSAAQQYKSKNTGGKETHLQTDVCKAKRIECGQVRNVKQGLPDNHHQKCRNDKGKEGLGKGIGGFEETTDEQPIEQPQNQQDKAKIYEIGVHQGVFSVHGSFRQYRHADSNSRSSQNKVAPFDHEAKQIFPPYDIPFGHRQKGGVEDIICFSCALKGLKKPKADKECANQYGIAGEKGQQGKGDEEV